MLRFSIDLPIKQRLLTVSKASHCFPENTNAAPLTRLAPFCIAGFTLAAYCKNEYGIDFGDIAIQGDIAVRLLADHQFPLAVTDGAADPRVVFEYVESVDYFQNTQIRVFDLVLGQVVEDAIKIIPYLRCQFDSRHLNAPIFLLSGA